MDLFASKVLWPVCVCIVNHQQGEALVFVETWYPDIPGCIFTLFHFCRNNLRKGGDLKTILCLVVNQSLARILRTSEVKRARLKVCCWHLYIWLYKIFVYTLPKKEPFFSFNGDVGADVVLLLPWPTLPELLTLKPFGSWLSWVWLFLDVGLSPASGSPLWNLKC